jgi:pre-mRNA cleavage complex 2 protein Pcf11
MPPAHGAHAYYGAPQQPGYVGGVNADVLNKDIEDLVLATRVEYAQNPHDGSIPTRLKALMDLQAIVQAKNLPQDQLVLVKKQVDELAVKMRVPQVGSTTTGLTPNHQHQHPVPLPASVAPPPSTSSAGTTPVPLPLAQVPTPVPTASAPVPAQPQGHVTIDSLLGKGALAALLAQQAERSARSTPAPAPPATHTPPQPPPAMPAAAPPQAQDPMALIHQLRQAGLLGAAGHAAAPVAPPAAPAAPSIPTRAMQSAALASLPPVLARVLSPMKAWAPPPPPVDSRELSWNLASLQVV